MITLARGNHTRVGSMKPPKRRAGFLRIWSECSDRFEANSVFSDRKRSDSQTGQPSLSQAIFYGTPVVVSGQEVGTI